MAKVVHTMDTVALNVQTPVNKFPCPPRLQLVDWEHLESEDDFRSILGLTKKHKNQIGSLQFSTLFSLMPRRPVEVWGSLGQLRGSLGQSGVVWATMGQSGTLWGSVG